MSSGRKRCFVVGSAPGGLLEVTVEVAEDATVSEVIAAARRQSQDETVPWECAPVGIFGELCDRRTRPRDGDRIELYRPLRIDPKAARRSRARRRACG
jgi:putative ubiquitin-RnfH superfamily antitoxin RatB of RatAB toxin-antitoxin module